MIDTDKYEGTGFGERKGYEVIWLHELDEESSMGIMGGGVETPRPCFHHYKVAFEYCEQVKLKSRACILEYRKGAMWNEEGWEDEFVVWKEIKWSEEE